MNRLNTLAALASSAVLSLVAARAPVFAQIDLSGNWSAINSTDAGMDAPDEPLPDDYLGMPINASGRTAALMHSDGQLFEPERVCEFYSPVYLMLGPFGLRLWNETEPSNGTTVAWRIGGWQDFAPMTIWMDGRPHPSDYEPHPRGGFTTGVWQDDVLTAYTTHMRAGISRRNGAPHSDQATMTTWFLRHGEELTVFARVVDPVYFSQPFLMTRDFAFYVAQPQYSMGAPCVASDEGVPEGAVPFYLPGQNPSTHVIPDTYGIPLEAAMGGAQTMYPQYRKLLEHTYKRPETCQKNAGQAAFPNLVCGGPGKYPRRGPGN